MTEVESNTERSGNRPPLHKRQFVVDKPFQYRLIGTLSSIWAAYSLFFTIVLYFLYEGHLKRFYTLMPRPGTHPLLELSMLFPVSVAFVLAFGFTVLGIIALYVSNQIAGPLYRTKLGMERVGRGDLSVHLRFREGDFLRDIPGIFNAMVDGLRRQSEADIGDIYALEQATNDPVKLRRLLRELRERKEAAASISGREAVPEAPRQVSLTVS